MDQLNSPSVSLPPLPRGMYWLGDGTKAERAALNDEYRERLCLTNLVRLTHPDSSMHGRAKARLLEIESSERR